MNITVTESTAHCTRGHREVVQNAIKLGNYLVKLTSSVTNSYVQLKIDPANKTATTKYTGSKVIFKATYFSLL